MLLVWKWSILDDVECMLLCVWQPKREGVAFHVVWIKETLFYVDETLGGTHMELGENVWKYVICCLWKRYANVAFYDVCWCKMGSTIDGCLGSGAHGALGEKTKSSWLHVALKSWGVGKWRRKRVWSCWKSVKFYVIKFSLMCVDMLNTCMEWQDNCMYVYFMLLAWMKCYIKLMKSRVIHAWNKKKKGIIYMNVLHDIVA